MELEIVHLISLAGIAGGITGSLLTAAAQAWFGRKLKIEERNFKEKKETYAAFWSSHLNLEKKDDDAAKRDFIYWHTRSELVAPVYVRRAMLKVIKVNDDPAQVKAAAHEELKEAMRKDLGIEPVDQLKGFGS